jgi:hypothetical protein
MRSYLIYHPPRVQSTFDGIKVYHDPIKRGNQDPYLWNKQFLHTYCHITQLRLSQLTQGDINFWVSGNTFPDFTQLFCDLVFVLQDKCQWKERNHIERTDPIVDSDIAYQDHYQWAGYEHCFKRRQRFTLKANPLSSFQPQDATQKLIDVVPFLVERGLSLDELNRKFRAGFNSQPFSLYSSIANSLYDWLEKIAEIKLTGDELEPIRRMHPQLASSSLHVKTCAN